jgi:hypothetical protein
MLDPISRARSVAKEFKDARQAALTQRGEVTTPRQANESTEGKGYLLKLQKSDIFANTSNKATPHKSRAVPLDNENSAGVKAISGSFSTSRGKKTTP